MRMTLATGERLVGRLSPDAIKDGLRDRLKVARESGVGRVPRLWGVQDLVDAAKPYLVGDLEMQALVRDAIRLGLANV